MASIVGNNKTSALKESKSDELKMSIDKKRNNSLSRGTAAYRIATHSMEELSSAQNSTPFDILSNIYVSECIHALLSSGNKVKAQPQSGIQKYSKDVVVFKLNESIKPQQGVDGASDENTNGDQCNDKALLKAEIHSTEPFLFTCSFKQNTAPANTSETLNIAGNRGKAGVGNGTADGKRNDSLVHWVSYPVEGEGSKRRCLDAAAFAECQEKFERVKRRTPCKLSEQRQSEVMDKFRESNNTDTYNPKDVVERLLFRGTSDPLAAKRRINIEQGKNSDIASAAEEEALKGGCISLKMLNRRFNIRLKNKAGSASESSNIKEEACMSMESNEKPNKVEVTSDEDTYYLEQKELAPFFEQLMWVLYVLVPRWAYLEFSYKWHTTFLGEIVHGMDKKDRLIGDATSQSPQLSKEEGGALPNGKGTNTVVKPNSTPNGTTMVSKISLSSMKRKGPDFPLPQNKTVDVKEKSSGAAEYRSSSSTAFSSMVAASSAFPIETIERYLQMLQPLCALLYPSPSDISALLSRKGAVLIGSRNANRRSFLQQYLIERLCQHFDSGEPSLDFDMDFSVPNARRFFEFKFNCNDEARLDIASTYGGTVPMSIVEGAGCSKEDYSLYTTSHFTSNLIFKAVIFKVLRDIDQFRSYYDPDFIGWTEGGLQAVVNSMQKPSLGKALGANIWYHTSESRGRPAFPKSDEDEEKNKSKHIEDSKSAEDGRNEMGYCTVLPKFGAALHAGVYWLPKDRKVRAEWRDGTRKKKIALSFSTVKYGEARARYLAISGRVIGEICGLCIPRNERQSVLYGMPEKEKKMFRILRGVHKLKTFTDTYLCASTPSTELFPGLSTIASALDVKDKSSSNTTEDLLGRNSTDRCKALNSMLKDLREVGEALKKGEDNGTKGMTGKNGIHSLIVHPAISNAKDSKDSQDRERIAEDELVQEAEADGEDVAADCVSVADSSKGDGSTISGCRTTPPVWNNVYFYAQRNQWRMSYKDPKTRKRSHKAFVCTKYGYQEAKKLALKARIEAARVQGNLDELGDAPDNSFWKDYIYAPMSHAFFDGTKGGRAAMDVHFPGEQPSSSNHCSNDGSTSRTVTRNMKKIAMQSDAKMTSSDGLGDEVSIFSSALPSPEAVEEFSKKQGLNMSISTAPKGGSSNKSEAEHCELPSPANQESSSPVLNRFKTLKTASTTLYDETKKSFTACVYVHVARGVKLESFTPLHQKEFSEEQYGNLKLAREESEKWRKRMIKREQRRMQSKYLKVNVGGYGSPRFDEDGCDRSSGSATADEMDGKHLPQSVGSSNEPVSSDASTAGTKLSAVDSMTLSLIRRRPSGAIITNTDSHAVNLPYSRTSGESMTCERTAKSELAKEEPLASSAGDRKTQDNSGNATAGDGSSVSSWSDSGSDMDDTSFEKAVTVTSAQLSKNVVNKAYIEALEVRMKNERAKLEKESRDRAFKSVIPGVTFHHGKSAWRMRWVSTRTGRDTSRWYSTGDLGVQGAKHQAESMKLHLLKVGEAQGPVFGVSTMKYIKLLEGSECNHKNALLKGQGEVDIQHVSEELCREGVIN